MTTESLKRLWRVVFGDPDSFIDSFFETAYSPDRCLYIEAEGEAVSALYWFDCAYAGGKLAYIYAVATQPDHRGKGLASCLLEKAHALLQERGYAGSVLKPAQGLFPFYERLGYETCGYIRRLDARAGLVPAEIRELSPAEFGQLRRKYLPEEGIVQEGLTLQFLHTFARFFASFDAIFCIFREEPVFFEYLGNPNSAPGILAALGIEQAEIPTVGTDIPFAMWHPLNCTKKPGYLGITLE